MICAAVARGKYGSHGEKGMLFAVHIAWIRANIKRAFLQSQLYYTEAPVDWRTLQKIDERSIHKRLYSASDYKASDLYFMSLIGNLRNQHRYRTVN